MSGVMDGTCFGQNLPGGLGAEPPCGGVAASARTAALYVNPAGIYQKLGLDCWDIVRDARKYSGLGPVIAHPPCGHWGKYHRVCRLPGKDCGPIAVDQVRQYGGVLEHPVGSSLFRYCGCSMSTTAADLWGGRSLVICQGYYGHAALKPTRLYFVGVDRPTLPPPPVDCRTIFRPLENLGRVERSSTPLPFALLLLCLVSQVEG
jgi:hypothetical protein